MPKLFFVIPSYVLKRGHSLFVGVAVVRRVFLLDETFDLLFPSTAVGFTIASVESFRLNQSFLVSSCVPKRGRLLDFIIFRRVFLLE